MKGINVNRTFVRLASAGVALAAMCGMQPARAESSKDSSCTALAGPKAAIEAKHGSWITLTSAQWQFLRGVYVVNPNTPPGLPYGDKAALVQVDGRPGGLVFFIDGALACSPMDVPGALIAMVMTVGVGDIGHEGDGL